MQIKRQKQNSKPKQLEGQKRGRKRADKTLLKAFKLTPDLCAINLEHPFGQISIIFLRDLRLIGRPVENRGVVVHIIDVNHDGGVVFIEIVRRHQAEFILGKRCDDTEDNIQHLMPRICLFLR